MTRAEFEAAKARLVGPHGELTALMKQMGGVPKDQRPVVGKLINEAKTQLQRHLDDVKRDGYGLVAISYDTTETLKGFAPCASSSCP